jgi:hypothetical protein
MSFDRSLGNVQLPCDFGIVTPLKKQIYDLLFPRPHLIELFFHNLTGPKRALVAVSGAKPSPGRIQIKLLRASHFAFTSPKEPFYYQISVKSSICCLFATKKRRNGGFPGRSTEGMLHL